MNIVHRRGDALAAGLPVLHGCNASGFAFASGFAGQVRAKYPFAYEAYTAAHRTAPLQLGEVIMALRGDVLIFNGITQLRYGPKGTGKYVSDEAIAGVIRNVDRLAAASQRGDLQLDAIGPITSVAMPKIGSDLGGGDWTVIEAIIATYSLHFQPVVYTLAK